MPQAGQYDPPADTLEHLGDDIRELSERWLPQAAKLRDFFEHWESAWNSHHLDAMEKLIAPDITFTDPALFGQAVESASEFTAFIQTLFRAFPDVSFHGTGAFYLDLHGGGIALPWRMQGTFLGELVAWSKNPVSEPLTTAPTGKSFDLEGVDLYRFCDGVLCDYSIVYDLLGFSAQIGLLR